MTMNAVLIIAAASILIAAYYIRNFFLYRSKIKALSQNGTNTQGLLLEVRNIGLQQNTPSNLNEIAVKFAIANGKDHIVRHRKELSEGEIIPVGSSVDLTYLESDPNVCNIPSLGLIAQNKWVSLAVGATVLVIGLFVAYVVFINIGTV